MATKIPNQSAAKPISPAARFVPSAASISSKKNPSDQVPREERIRFRAYFLAEAAGFPEGREDEFWFQAEKEIHC